ncbi:glycosyltransferase [Spirosoma sp.]|uniref:glycosyltransferase n=1 Tax=Spirosoma sp. TaxID=1899569 RepID=UPI002619208C|nr:glycosyltransferase [Spirosoma sp.]MCX6218476.1 glycosyltransferase [Spirosoma sp.]
MNPKRILFATMPMDGHLNPLTGLAVHLQQLGHDVRWYTGPAYADKIKSLGIPYYPYQQAKEINQLNLDTALPERQHIKGTIARLRFDLNNLFLLRAPEFVIDLKAIYHEFPYDLLVCDMLFTGAPFIQKLLNVPVAAVGVVPLSETGRDVPPAGLGMVPANGFFGKLKQDFIRYLTVNHLLKPCTDLFNQLLEEHGLATTTDFMFDTFIRQPDLFLQSGTPAFEYPRQTMSPNIRFVGPMLPHNKGGRHPFRQVELAKQYKNVVLVTQGTVERDPAKIIVPTLEAYKDDPKTLVIVTTGGSRTDELRTRYPQANFIIEDFIDFNSVMPHVHVYVTNAGYGGVTLALQHGLPMVAAGVYEGKNDIAAHIGYFNVGINLKTETPTAAQIRKSVVRVLADRNYKRNVQRIGIDFMQYDTNTVCTTYIHDLLGKFEPETEFV